MRREGSPSSGSRPDNPRANRFVGRCPATLFTGLCRQTRRSRRNTLSHNPVPVPSFAGNVSELRMASYPSLTVRAKVVLPASSRHQHTKDIRRSSRSIQATEGGPRSPASTYELPRCYGASPVERVDVVRSGSCVIVTGDAGSRSPSTTGSPASSRDGSSGRGEP
jgi:hypothetical protein